MIRRRRTTTTKTKKKIYKRRYTRGYRGFIKSTGGYTSLSIRRPSVLPDAISVTLDYCNENEITGVTAPEDFIYVANGMFAPETGGHQPMGYDQFSAFYTRYRVLACSIDIQWASNNAASSGIILVPNDDNTSFSVATTAGETVRAKVGTLTSNDQPTTRMRMYKTTCEMLGLNGIDVLDDVYSALISANPSRLWYYHVVFFTSAGGTLTGAYVVKLKYYCQFYARKSLASS